MLHRTAASPQAAVLVLHGGRADGLDAPPPWNLPGARMRPYLRAVARATEGRDVVVGAVRYRYRGWNGVRGDAARDAERALEELRALAGPVPVVLVGHSMGGRAALRAAAHDLVTGVVGLAPWCPPGEPVDHLRGRRLVLLHGNRDRMTDPRGSWELAVRARVAGAESCHLTVVGGDHAMLRRAVLWHTRTAESVRGLLGYGPLPDVVARALARTDVPPPGGTGTALR
ncbi:alpha/beta fold hydrolase [Streptomyces sp. RKND-216]|uniref:alpha/beta fold hydrolase n=1 Tax=Streptomyces sp. RKND-216 TaxID=2562581 RepID=UPI00109E0CC3|nr:alpha/beta fold hydrolase [Streptomyces sp. RKND-216]THA27562.1 alpha/beta fold hydrolase [Streptomyces sp. RKND-216]